MSITDHGTHILPDESAAGTWHAAFDAEESLVFHQDNLTCGPLRAFESLSDWTALRQDFWNTIDPEWAQQVFRYSYDDDITLGAPHSSSRLRDAPAIYIWAGNNLHDQLFVIFTIHLIERTGADPAAIHFVPFEVRPHHRGRFISVASSSIDDLKDHPEPVQMSNRYLATARAAWDAITGETPAALVDFAGAGTNRVQGILILPGDDTRAVALLERSAAQGHADAMEMLGWAYEVGRGTDADEDRALDWYKKAAENGSEGARESVERIRKKNQSLTERFVEWLTGD